MSRVRSDPLARQNGELVGSVAHVADEGVSNSADSMSIVEVVFGHPVSHDGWTSQCMLCVPPAKKWVAPILWLSVLCAQVVG